MKFAAIKNDCSKEANVVFMHCLKNDIPLIRVAKGQPVPEGCIPTGSVEWCSTALGKITPDYYPEWLSPLLYRKVWQTDRWPKERVFIKPSDRYKRFTGFVTSGGYRKKKRPPFWCSEVVSFTNEWRYYIANGKVLAAEWYWGDEINTPDAPEFPIAIPESYCGAVDLGDAKGTLTLVEANHPFACGWYGVDRHERYVEWLVTGWQYMRLRRNPADLSSTSHG